MKLKSLAVITLVVLGFSFASAQIGTFSFWNAAQDEVYCDYLIITYNSGGVVAGYENLTDPQEAGGCELTENAAAVGFDATTPNGGQPAHGKGIVVGAALYDAEYDSYTGLQWTLWLTGKASKENKNGIFIGPFGWMRVAGAYTGTYFGDNYGYLAAGRPDKAKVAGHRTTAGKLPSELRK